MSNARVKGVVLCSLLMCVVALASCSVVIGTSSLNDGVCAAGFKACNDECVATDEPGTGCAAATCLPCNIPRAEAICSPEGACVLSICNKGFTDCNGNSSDGCETQTGYDAKNCGQCGQACTADTTTHVATPGCSVGACVVGTCERGWANCNNITSDGCEINLATDNANCGACHAACSGGTTCNGDAQAPTCI